MPRLWNETIEAHRRTVRDAILDTTSALVAEEGLLSVTMSEIAQRTGIGRATLYKYFPDVPAILHAWHERQIAGHLDHLAQVGERAGRPGERLAAVLEAYAFLVHESQRHSDTEPAAFLHTGGRMVRAEQRVSDLMRRLLADAAESGDVRDDLDPAELAGYCLHALSAARGLRSKAAVRRLVAVTTDALRPPH